MNTNLLTRDEFRKQVFSRDKYACVFCKKTTELDAHHIMERRLFSDGGYYVNNGATVCGLHHLMCESTEISTDAVREACNIHKVILPPHLYDDEKYDKWGNIILDNNTRLRGELFHDESVQKVLSPVLHLFTNRVKYPRTHHLPWSPGIHDDDRIMPSLLKLKKEEVVVTEKMDGENTTLYNNYIHARSLTFESHESRTWVKNMWSSIRHSIPDNWRICGENLYAQHSIKYDNLVSYFYGFSIWNEVECLDWDSTTEWFELLDIPMPNVLYRGAFDEKFISNISFNTDFIEGYVVRVTRPFTLREFPECVGKVVRKDHVKTTKHWFRGKMVLKNSTSLKTH